MNGTRVQVGAAAAGHVIMLELSLKRRRKSRAPWNAKGNPKILNLSLALLGHAQVKYLAFRQIVNQSVLPRIFNITNRFISVARGLTSLTMTSSLMMAAATAGGGIVSHVVQSGTLPMSLVPLYFPGGVSRNWSLRFLD